MYGKVQNESGKTKYLSFIRELNYDYLYTEF